MAKVCAYCGELKKLSREHLYAASIARTEPNMRTFVDNVRDRVSTSAPVIKDVCEDCNNGPLSKLDTYGAELYRRYFMKVRGRRVGVAFRYDDYDVLARWLLKMLYNDTRTHGHGRDVLAQCAGYIRGAAPIPPFGLTLHLGIIETVPSTARERFVSGVHAYLEPHVIRYGELKQPLKPAGTAIVRSVCLKSFVFLVGLWNTPPPADDRDVWGRLVWVRNMRRLSPAFGTVVVRKPFADSRNYLFGPWLDHVMNRPHTPIALNAPKPRSES